MLQPVVCKAEMRELVKLRQTTDLCDLVSC